MAKLGIGKNKKLCPMMSKVVVGQEEEHFLFEVECRKDCALLVKGVFTSINNNENGMGYFCGLIQEG